MKPRKDENMVWTDSQDYGATQDYGVDEILHTTKLHYFTKQPDS